MKIKHSSISDSIKDSELNRILEKISSGIELSKNEQVFLGKFPSIEEEDLISQSHLSLQKTHEIVNSLLKKSKKVICDLYDRDGKIGIQISSSEEFNGDYFLVNLRGGETFKLKDNYLYSIFYYISKDEYSLQIQGEYSEKLYVNNED